MNIRQVVFCGVITSLLGVVLAIGAARVTYLHNNQLKYQSQAYKELNHNYYPIIGGVLGLIIGMGQESVRQLKHQRDQELEGSDHWKF